MNRRPGLATLLILVALLEPTSTALRAQRPTTPLPPGNRIIAQDGDVVIVDNDARVSIVRRRDGYVRTVFDTKEHWLLVLVDLATPASPADGSVDWAYHYRDVGGDWPLGSRWEGVATIEDYSMAVQGTRGLGVATAQGLVQLFAREGEFADRDAMAVLSFRGSGGSGSLSGIGFDEAERWYTAELRRNDGVIRTPGGTGSLVTSVKGGFAGGVSGGIQRGPDGAVRVGGSVRSPVKILDVKPVLPEQAARAGVRGIVILEVTIDVDGTVKNPRVLRSVPLLDAAAIEAVQQWRYEPTSIGDKVVPVIMTVPVTF